MSFAYGFGLPHWHPLSGGFSPASLFTGGVQGAWYDPSDSTTLFSDRAGTTPCAAPGAGAVVPVGLMLDKSQGLVLGSDVVVNGDFASGASWTPQAGWAISGGAANATASSSLIYQSNAGILVNRYYEVTFTVSNYVAGSVRPYLGATPTYGSFVSANGTYTQRFSPTVNGNELGFGASGFTGSIDNVSIKQVLGNHAIAANDTTARPELSARVNLLTRTEEFDFTGAPDAIWTKAGSSISANSIASPNGTLTADTLIENANNSPHGVYGLVSAAVNIAQNLTLSVYAKALTRSQLRLVIWGGSGGLGEGTRAGANFDLIAETATLSSAGGWAANSCSIQSVGNGWYRCVANISMPSYPFPYFTIVLGNGGSYSYAGDGTSGLYIWGADLRPTNIGSQIPAYQRVADQYTYDSAGFPRRLVFNGTNSAMSTPANVNLSGTDKATVFLGLRKANDNSGYVPLEFSNASGWTVANGSFAIYAPSYLSGSFPAPKYFVGLRGTNQRQEEFSTFTAPITNVLSESIDIAAAVGSEISMRINGATVSPSVAVGDAGSGNFGNYPITIGVRSTGTNYFPGDIYSLIVVGSAVSAGSISSTETWVNGKTGGVY